MVPVPASIPFSTSEIVEVEARRLPEFISLGVLFGFGGIVAVHDALLLLLPFLRFGSRALLACHFFLTFLEGWSRICHCLLD